MNFLDILNNDASRQPANREVVAKPQSGNTAFYPVIATVPAPDGKYAFGAKAFEFFLDDETGNTRPTYRYLFYAAIVAADDLKNKLPANVGTHIVPMAIGGKVQTALEEAIKQGHALTYVTESGFIQVGTLFHIRRAGEGLGTTYTLSPMPSTRQKDYPFPQQIEWPQDDIVTFAAAFTEAAQQRHNEYKAAKSQPALPSGNPRVIGGQVAPDDEGDIPF